MAEHADNHGTETAAHTESGHEAAAHHAGIGDLLWPTLNFAIFIAVIVRFAGPALRAFFRERAERLRDALAAGTRARREAEALRAQLAADLADLPAIRERLKADLRATAERERDTLLDAGRQAAERIRNDARVLAEQEVVAARRALRAEVIDEAVREATAIIRSTVTPEDQERFARDFVQTASGATA